MSGSTVAGGPGRRSSRVVDLLLAAWALFIVYGTTLPLTLSAGWSDLPETVANLVSDGDPVERLRGEVRPDVEEMVWTLLDSPY